MERVKSNETGRRKVQVHELTRRHHKKTSSQGARGEEKKRT